MLTPRWISRRDLVWTHYDDSDEWVVFNPASGDVHLLTSSARTLWQAVDQSPSISNEEILATLASRLGRSIDADLDAAVRDTIEFMDSAGLIAPANA